MLASALQSVRNFDRRSISRYLLTLVALFAMTTGALADEATITLKCGTTEKTYENVTLPWSTTGEILKAVISDYKNVASNIDAITGGDGKVVKYGSEQFTVTGTFSGEATVVVSWYNSSKQSATITVTAPGPLLTLNEAKTEATMESMPTYDVTVDYELVRDMSVQMQAQVGDDPAKQPRYRVQWNDEKETFEPAELKPEQVLALFSVNDLIEKQALDMQNYFVNIYAVDAEGNPTGNAMDFTNFTFAPGRYCVTATGGLGGPYDGTTAPSNIFELFQGYEVEVPAGEYITYYKDEALYVEDEEAKLYTITTVSGTTATANELTIAPANTPILVQNNGSETKTILLIPTTEETDASINVYDGFKGTLEAKTTTNTDTYGPWNMAEGKKYYAFNGLQFVWVKDALDIAANKAWLEVTATAIAAPQIRLVFNSATGIERVDREQSTVDSWYSLDGRRLPGKPSQKGIYIVNGKKVVIK